MVRSTITELLVILVPVFLKLSAFKLISLSAWQKAQSGAKLLEGGVHTLDFSKHTTN